MSYHRVPGTDFGYFMICVDAEGSERPEVDGQLASDAVLAALKAAPETSDIFVLTHGWKGDVPEAIKQFDLWIGQMHAVRPDLASKRANGFKSLVVGLHWPSLPWGDEKLVDDGKKVLGEPVGVAMPLTLSEEIDSYAAVLSDSPAARAALDTILSAARGARSASRPELEAAYATLVSEAAVADDDELGPASQSTSADTVLGGSSIADGFLSAVRQLSFWKMKARASLIGRKAGGPLLERLHQAAPNARLHLMGHSFGCIVVSQSVLAGPKVHSLFLVQGALSLWAFAPKIPALNLAGAFAAVLAQGKVQGPIVATVSSKDTAVKTYYPVAARLGRQVVLAATSQLPKYGGIGTFGVQGVNAQTGPLAPVTTQYRFQRGKVYNLESSQIIAQGQGPSGAHSDIAHPEVAHAFWQAAMVD